MKLVLAFLYQIVEDVKLCARHVDVQSMLGGDWLNDARELLKDFIILVAREPLRSPPPAGPCSEDTIRPVVRIAIDEPP